MSNFRLGLFGDTRSGKTMYLTALYGSAQDGTLPGRTNLRASPGSSLRHLNTRLAMIRAGQWPPGDLDTEPVELLVDYRRRTFSICTRDFKGGDFGNITEPESKAEFERFIGELFEGCSAYVFLVDPGVLLLDEGPAGGDDTEFRRHRQSLRVISAVNMALEKLRGAGRVSHLMHRPVAVVFTKCDLHPEVTADPEAFARRHMESTCRYLDQHAPRRHRYFAVSSTGPLTGDPASSPPPSPLRPQNLTAPLLWCIDQHLQRYRLLKRLLVLVLILLLVSGYASLFLNNGHQLSTITDELRYADDARLPALYREADALSRSVLVLPTHPAEAERVRQSVVHEARHRLQEEIDKRVDPQGNVREVKEFQELAGKVETFTNRYPGTADAQDMQAWLKSRRQAIAQRTVEELEQLAKEGKELAFDDKLKQYALVGTPECDDRTSQARQELNRRVVRRKVSLLFDVRVSNPRDVAEVRRKCNEAEKEIAARRLPDTDLDVLYVRKVRTVYDGLAAGGLTRELRLTIHVPYKKKIRWQLYQNRAEPASRLTGSTGWETPAPNPREERWYMVSSQPFTIDLLETKVLLFTLTEDAWLGKPTAQAEVGLSSLDFGAEMKFSTSKGVDYYLSVYDDRKDVRQFYQDLGEIARLEDVIFRAPSAR